MTSTRVAARLAASALITISLGQVAFAQDDDFACRKRAVYDYCGAVLLAATGQLMQTADGEAIITQLRTEFESYFGAFKDLPEHEVVQKNVMLSALEHYSLDSVRACTGRSAELLEEVVDMVDRECRENQ